MKGEVQMTNSKRIAGLLGPTLIAVTISEAMNLRIWTTSAGPSLAPFVYLNGTLLFVAGLSIVRVHNRWTGVWPVLVTLIGWLAILGGLIRMIAPVSAQRTGQNTTAVFALLIVLLAIGIFLTVKAYGREDSETVVHAGCAR
jgi:uncharacterized membrane protein HdeD (DUF308 family)